MSARLRANRWLALIVLSLTQLMVVLDGTIVTIALPDAQRELALTDGMRQWVVTAYALAFGALLLLGGRVADYWGRKRTLLLGMLGFGVASVIAGVAPSGELLVLGRGLQGAFAALLAPSALAILTVTFPRGRDRNTAFAVFGTIAGAGAAIGLVLGGVLTEFADWRWCLLVNVFFIVVCAVGCALFVSESKAGGENRFDVLGGLTVALGLGSLAYGFGCAELGWGRLDTIAFLSVGVVLLMLFVWIESRVAQPLLPLRVIADRTRAGAFLIQAVAGSTMIGATVFLTFHLQLVLQMSPLQSGLASLPLPFAITAFAPLASRLLPRLGARALLVFGPLVAAAGLFMLSAVSFDGGYAAQVLPGLLVIGAGMAFVFVPLQNVALAGIAPHDAGAASATANAAMQIGGSIGVSVFTAVYVAETAGRSDSVSLSSGNATVFVAAAVGMTAAAMVAAVSIRRTNRAQAVPVP